MQITPSSIYTPEKPSLKTLLIDTAELRSNIMELDTNNDGEISGDEFAAYRTQKQAAGQFVPQGGGIREGSNALEEKIQQSIFEALLQRGA